jgi:hypothetical protein
VISSVRDFLEFSQRVVRGTLLLFFSPVLSAEIRFFAPRAWRCFISSLQKCSLIFETDFNRVQVA